MSRVIGCAFCECDIEGMHHDLDCPNHPDNFKRPDAAPPKKVVEKFACEVCGVSSHKTATYRVNPKGEPGIFRCEACLETPPDRDAKELVDIIAAGSSPPSDAAQKESTFNDSLSQSRNTVGQWPQWKKDMHETIQRSTEATEGYASRKVSERARWKQERPMWCPHQDCVFCRRSQDALCGGRLPKPEPHEGDENTHRLCVNTVGEVFDLQVNKTDLGYFRWILDALDGKKTSWLSRDAHPDAAPLPSDAAPKAWMHRRRDGKRPADLHPWFLTWHEPSPPPAPYWHEVVALVAAHPDAAPPTLDDILGWLSAEAEWWAGDRNCRAELTSTRRFQTNLVWQRLTEWRDTGKEPVHGL